MIFVRSGNLFLNNFLISMIKIRVRTEKHQRAKTIYVSKNVQEK